MRWADKKFEVLVVLSGDLIIHNDEKKLFLDFQMFNYSIIPVIIWKFSCLIWTFDSSKINDSESYDRRINMNRILWPKVYHLFYYCWLQLIFKKNFLSPLWNHDLIHGNINLLKLRHLKFFFIKFAFFNGCNFVQIQYSIS